MKKILFFLLLSISAFSQTTLPVTTTGAVNRGYQNLGTVMFDTHLRIPVGNTTPNYSNVTNKGFIRVNSVTNILEYHNGTGWVSFTELIDDSVTVSDKTWSSEKIASSLYLIVNDISSLESFNGSQTTLIVKDSLRGGIFNYISTGGVDNGIVFNATGKGSGYWKRQYVEAEGRHPEWFGAKGDAVQNGFAIIGTDDSQAIQATIDSYEHRNGLVQFTRSYRLSNSLELGEGTHLRGQSSLGPYQITTTDTIFYKSNTALWFDSGVDGIGTTQDTVNYRNLGVKLEYLGIFSTGDLRTKVGLKLLSNPNAAAGLTHPGLPIVNFCFFSGWDTCIDASDADSFDLLWSHLSECRIGVIGGSSELYAYRNNFYKFDETGYALNGTNDVVTGNEFEPTNTTGVSIVMGTTSKRAMIFGNNFKNQAKCFIIKGSGNNNEPGSHIITNNVMSGNYGNRFIDIESSATRIQIRNNSFASDNKNEGATNFIYAASGASNLEISGNEFTKFAGGLVNKTIVSDGIVNLNVYGNNHNGFTEEESIPSVNNTSFTALKDGISQTTAKDWGDLTKSLESSYNFTPSNSYMTFSSIPSLFSYSGTFYIKFRTPSSYVGNQKIIGGATPRFYIELNSTGQLSITIGDNVAHAVMNNLTTSTDYELLFTYSDPDNNGSGVIQPYFNGRFVTGTFNYTGFTSLPTNLAIGRNGAADYFKGKVYDIKWFDQVFTDNEAYAFLKTPNKILPYPTKLDLYKIKSSTTWFDQSGNSRHITNVGATMEGGELSNSINYLTANKANNLTPTFIGPVTISSGGLAITGGLATDIINGTGGVTNGSTFVQTRSIGTLVPSNVAIATGDNFNVFANKTQGQINNTVKLTGDQTKTGILTLLSSPIVPTATLSTQAVNLGQLSDYTEASVNEVILGTWDFQSSSNIGFRRAFISSNSTNTSLSVDNASTGYGVEIRNFANGSGALYVDNQQNGNGVIVDSDISTTGKNFKGQNNGTDTFTVDRVGDVVANKYTKTGGVATEFLMADGSVNTIANTIGVAGSFSGVGTATTTFTVTIGATQPNNTYKVNATPTNLLSAAVFYVTNKTTTTFDVVYLAGLTGTVEFDWSLRP